MSCPPRAAAPGRLGPGPRKEVEVVVVVVAGRNWHFEMEEMAVGGHSSESRFRNCSPQAEILCVGEEHL